MPENVIERAMVPRNPSTARVVNQERYNLFVPVARTNTPGVAAYNANDFVIAGQTVSLNPELRTTIEETEKDQYELEERLQEVEEMAANFELDVDTVVTEFAEVKKDFSNLEDTVINEFAVVDENISDLDKKKVDKVESDTFQAYAEPFNLPVSSNGKTGTIPLIYPPGMSREMGEGTFAVCLPDYPGQPTPKIYVDQIREELGGLISELDEGMVDEIRIYCDTSDYKLKIELLDKMKRGISIAEVDFPLESMVIGGDYKDGILYLTLNDYEDDVPKVIEINISDIVNGLVSESQIITSITPPTEELISKRHIPSMSTLNALLNRKVSVPTGFTGKVVKVFSSDGYDELVNITGTNETGTIARYTDASTGKKDQGGIINTSIPEEDFNCTPKIYVDEQKEVIQKTMEESNNQLRNDFENANDLLENKFDEKFDELYDLVYGEYYRPLRVASIDNPSYIPQNAQSIASINVLGPGITKGMMLITDAKVIETSAFTFDEDTDTVTINGDGIIGIVFDEAIGNNENASIALTFSEGSFTGAETIELALLDENDILIEYVEINNNTSDLEFSLKGLNLKTIFINSGNNPNVVFSNFSFAIKMENCYAERTVGIPTTSLYCTGKNLFDPSIMDSAFYEAGADGSLMILQNDWRGWDSVPSFTLYPGTYYCVLGENSTKESYITVKYGESEYIYLDLSAATTTNISSFVITEDTEVKIKAGSIDYPSTVYIMISKSEDGYIYEKYTKSKIFDVPVSIQNLTCDYGLYKLNVYGLAMSETVYNYIDFANRKFVVKCIDISAVGGIGSGLIEYNDEIDLTGYFDDDDIDIEISGSKILLTDNKGMSVGDKAYHQMLYIIKTGGV